MKKQDAKKKETRKNIDQLKDQEVNSGKIKGGGFGYNFVKGQDAGGQGS